MNYRELLSQIREGRISPIYFFHGEERFLLEDALSRLRKAVIPEGAADFNYTLLSGNSTRPEEIINLCQTFPVISRYRLIVVREIEALGGSEALGPYLGQPSPSTCLVLVAGKVDQRRRLFSLLRSKGVEVHFGPLNDSQILAWMKERCRTLGISLSQQAMLHLKERAGQDLFHVQNELEKISLVGAHGNPLGPEDIELLLSGRAAASAFEWLDAIRGRDRERAIRLLAALLDSGEYPLSLLGLLASNLRRRVRGSESKGGGVGAPRARREGMDRNLMRAFNLCMEADSKLKGSRLSPQLILEELVSALCSPEAGGAITEGRPESRR